VQWLTTYGEIEQSIRHNRKAPPLPGTECPLTPARGHSVLAQRPVHHLCILSR
jgi:hypothetical protein